MYTTDSGIEIKLHKVAGQTVANSGVQYFTLGSYNGTPLNWIILAAGSTLVETSTPAGIAINNDSAKQAISMMVDTKLSANQMLVISEKVLECAPHVLNDPSVSAKRTNTPKEYFASASFQTVASDAAKSLLDQKSDYLATGYTNNIALSNQVNNLITGSSLGLSSYLDNLILKSANFGNTYGITLSHSQINQYLPSSLINAQNLSGTITPYQVSDIADSIVNNGSSWVETLSNGNGRKAHPSGSGTCTFYGTYLDNGVLKNNTCSVVIKGTISSAGDTLFSTDWYTKISSAVCTYSLQTSKPTSTQNYVRPAMVIKI